MGFAKLLSCLLIKEEEAQNLEIPIRPVKLQNLVITELRWGHGGLQIR